MTRRFLISSLAVGLLALGGLNAQAGPITLPSDLATLETPGNFAIVGNLEFYNFTYVVSPPSSPPLLPPASGVTVSPFNALGPPVETGITFNGGFFAAAGTTVDYAITYWVKNLTGGPITDAYLAQAGAGNLNGTGQVSITETIFDHTGLNVISKAPFEVSLGGKQSDLTPFSAPDSVIVVKKDILLVGGSNGAAASFIDQGFSTTVVPEPASMALLGIGLSGLFTFRRFFKRTSVA